MPTISLRVNGRNYRFDCGEGEEAHLRTLADHLDGHLRSLIDAHGAVGDERLLMMVGLMVTDELMEARARIAELEAGDGEPRGRRRKSSRAAKRGAPEGAPEDAAVDAGSTPGDPVSPDDEALELAPTATAAE